MASPSMTRNAAGNALASQALALSASVTFNLDLSAKFEGQVQIAVTFGTVAATAGLQIQVFRQIGTGPVTDTVGIGVGFTIAATASTTQDASFSLPTGKYQVKLTNLDATNGLTGVSATMDTVDAVA